MVVSHLFHVTRMCSMSHAFYGLVGGFCGLVAEFRGFMGAFCGLILPPMVHGLLPWAPTTGSYKPLKVAT